MRPTTVEDGEQAFYKVVAAHEDGEPFDLILTDMHMPKMDGFNLIRRIREKPALVTATIMMLTSGGHRDDSRQCDELGVAARLLKPVRQSELRDAMIRALNPEDKFADTLAPEITALSQRRDSARQLRVLLAEDNPVNQLLATRLLEKRGHHVKVTGNGREALDALKKDRYDLVLMDVQMPEMDGIEATIALREMERESGVRQPVVALTAMVIKGDRERCIAAGMDGYLSKPIRQHELDEVLDGYIANIKRQEAPVQAPMPSAAGVIDEGELMDRIGNDLEFLSELAEVYRKEYPAQLSVARRALANSDADKLGQASHALKGALANLAATEPSRTASALEQIAASKDLASAGSVLDRLEEELSSVLAHLQSLCQETAK